MKATELQIGDWVDWYNSPFANPHYYAKVTSLCKQDDEPCNPIPLTAEILEKNGFTWTGGGDRSQMKTTDYSEEGQRWHIYVHHNAKAFDLHTSFPLDHPTIRNWRRSNGVKMEVCGFYVHELQHTLRLCGLIDLADNFKVV